MHFEWDVLKIIWKLSWPCFTFKQALAMVYRAGIMWWNLTRSWHVKISCKTSTNANCTR